MPPRDLGYPCKARVLAAIASLVFGCQRVDAGGLDYVLGEHVDYLYSPDFEPCGGNASSLDAYAMYAASMMGFSPDNLSKMSFSWVTPEALEEGTEGSCSHSCTIGVHALSILPILYHEMAHAFYYQVNPNPSHSLAEGFATVMDPFQLANYEIVTPRDPRELFTDSEFNSALYPVTGLFVAYLIQVHGVDKFQALYEMLAKESSLADWEEAFQAIYGAALDDVVENYLAVTECPQDIAPFPQFECEAPELEPESSGWTYERVLDCRDDDVVGGLDAEGGLATTVTFIVETPGEYDVEFLVPPMPKSLVRIGACDRCRWLPKETLFSGGQKTRVTFERGRHYMTVRVFETEPAQVYVGITQAQ